MGWKRRPTFIDDWPKDVIVDYAIFIDENGDSNLKHVKKCVISNTQPENIGNRFFQVSACCVQREHISEIKDRIVRLKNAHWEDGLFEYKGLMKRVVFHSREIRHAEGPFGHDFINHDDFLCGLSQVMVDSHFHIAAICIDKYKLVKKYSTPYDPYVVAVEFLMERLVRNYIPNGKKCLLVFEARNPDADRELLKKINACIVTGTDYANPIQLNCIAGVYFNRKWCESAQCLKSYFCLEIADLVGYPIYKYMTIGERDRAYQLIGRKILDYGLKKFP